MKPEYTVKYALNTRWGIYKGSTLLEGGFFSKEAAIDYMNKEYTNG